MTGAVLFIFFSVYLLAGIREPGSLSYFMPRLYGYLLLALSIALIVQDFALRKKEAGKDVLVLNFQGFLKSDSLKILLYLGIIIAYYAAVSYLGFVVSSVAFLIMSYLFLGVYKVSVHLFSLAIFGVLYAIFDFFLNVRFPHGWLY
jgi:hypothetical protein